MKSGNDILVSRPLSQEWPDVWQDFVRDDVVHLAKRMARDRHRWPSGLEAYVDDHAGMEVLLRAISGHPTHFVVLAKYADSKSEVLRADISIGGRPRHGGPAEDAHRCMVLIRVPHFVEDAKSVIGNVVGSTAVRLMTFEHFDLLGWHETVQDRFREFVEGILCGVDGKRQISVSLEGGRRARPHQVIEQGAQIVNKVRRDESQARRDRLMAGDLEDIAAAFQVTPTLGGKWLASPELLDLNVQMVKVQFRSLQPPFEIVQ